MKFFIDAASLGTTLPMMLFGMLGIFAVILVIWGFIAILNRVTKKAADEE
jgi:hypothetical protein